jgi:hypothetical protein
MHSINAGRRTQAPNDKTHQMDQQRQPGSKTIHDMNSRRALVLSSSIPLSSPGSAPCCVLCPVSCVFTIRSSLLRTGHGTELCRSHPGVRVNAANPNPQIHLEPSPAFHHAVSSVIPASPCHSPKTSHPCFGRLAGLACAEARWVHSIVLLGLCLIRFPCDNQL